MCNVGFVDNLLRQPEPNEDDPVSCYPASNRNAKYWHILDMDPTAVLTTRDTITDEEDNPGNQDADYRPVNNPLEAYYFCEVFLEADQSVSLVGDGEQPPLRIYARSVTNSDPQDFPVIIIGMTRYFDADLDFDVDQMDVAAFWNSFTGANTAQSPNAHATWNSLADWGTNAENREADGDVDLADYAVFYQRLSGSADGFYLCEDGDIPDNSSLPNGSPDVVVCAGPLHDIPQGTGACSAEECADFTCEQPETCGAPALNCPNCTTAGMGCGPTCEFLCAGDRGAVNPKGRLHLRVVETSSGDSCVTASVAEDDAVIDYKIVAELCDPDDELDDGLALWGADLEMVVPAEADAIELDAVTLPCDGSMDSFSTVDHESNTTNDGLNNPAGYGGTPFEGRLLQIGGAQNTIRNDTNDPPNGDVVENVGHSEIVLAEGSVTIPREADTGVYVLTLSNVFASVIVEGQIDLDGEFFRTERMDIGTVQHLHIRVDQDDVSISSSDPPNMFRDVLDTGDDSDLEHGIGADGTPDEGSVVYEPIEVVFDASTSLSADDVIVHCSYTGRPAAATPCPTVSAVSGSGTTYELTLSAPIPPGGCTTLYFANTCDVLQFESLPGDADLSGTTNTADLADLTAALNNSSANTYKHRYDINRNGTANTQDLLRLTQLLNGTLTTQAWNQMSVVPCAPAASVCPSSESFTGGGGGSLSEQEQEGVIAALQAACEEEAIESEECQAIIESLFGPQS